jgi:hypothetical protein
MPFWPEPISVMAPSTDAIHVMASGAEPIHFVSPDAEPIDGVASVSTQDQGVVHVFWLDTESANGFRSLSLTWAEGKQLADLRASLAAMALTPGFPKHLLDDASAFCRWGQRLRWTTPIRDGDEIAVLERISADAKQRRHDKVKSQRALGSATKRRHPGAQASMNRTPEL